MQTKVAELNATTINRQNLGLIIRSRYVDFKGWWDINDDLEKELSHDTEITYDYLLSLNGANTLIHPDDLQQVFSLPLGSHIDTIIHVITTDRSIKQLHLNGEFNVDDMGLKNGDRLSQHTGAMLISDLPAVETIRETGGVTKAKFERELRESQELLKSVIQSDVVALSVLKPIHHGDEIVDFEWILANKLQKVVAGGQNVVGKRYRQVFSSVHHSGTFEILKGVFETGERTVNEFYYEDKNIRGWFRGVYAKVNELLIVSSEDITARRKAELELLKHFRILQQTETVAGIGSWESVPSANEFSCSDGMYRLFEMDRQDAFTPESYLKFVIDADRPIAEKIVRHLTIDPVSFEEVIRIKPNGKEKTLKVRPVAVPDNDGKLSKLLGVDFDITAHAESEYLRELNSKLKEFDRAKTEFFSNVSHEFRTPLTLLLGPLQDLIRMRDEKHPDSNTQKLEMAYRNALRLQKLVNTLLDFSRIEAGKLEAFFQPTDLGVFTLEVAGVFRSAIERSGLKFITRAQEINEPIYVNHDMWEKIVLNLLSNAFKFTTHGKIELTLRSRKKHVQLHVRDTGVGISKDNIPKIFERFKRVATAPARTHEGSGIGLALVKELVSVHGGTIRVKSREGAGSEFIITIPKGKFHLPSKQIFETMDRLPAHAASASYAEEAMGWVPDHHKTARSKKKHAEEKPVVLVVDDNADMRQYLVDILSTDFEIVPFERAQKVLNYLAEEKRVDLVLSDVMLPELDGNELLNRIKLDSKYQYIPVLLLSARSSESDKIEGLHAGADDYLVKPFSSKELRTVVDSRIRIAKRQKEMQAVLDGAKQVEVQKNLQQFNDLLRQKNYELKCMNEELSNFAFIASHDLREPLRKIQLFSNTLVETEGEKISNRGREYCKKILNSVTRMNALIEDILSFSKASSAPKSRPTEFSLMDVADQVVNDLSVSIALTQASIRYQNLPVFNGNFLQITQLFENLITNSIKFQPMENKPIITITAEYIMGNEIKSSYANPSSRYLRVEFTDNGIGFEEQYSEKIFHMFQRLHNRAEFVGTGMGLAICKRVVENHNGFILARPNVERGSVFSCYFPVEL
ncbi:MAG TPA: ATP-binding protein [Chryseosolibacter sp.]